MNINVIRMVQCHYIPWLSSASLILMSKFGSLAIFLSQHAMAQVSNSFLNLDMSLSAVLTPTLSLISSWHICTHRPRLAWNCSSSDCTYCCAFWAGAEHLSTHRWASSILADGSDIQSASQRYIAFWTGRSFVRSILLMKSFIAF